MFEDWGKKLSGLGQQVGELGQHMMKKTGEVAEIASLHTRVLAKKKKVQEELAALGRIYYEAHKDEISEFEENITKINNLYIEIADLEEEIRVMKEKLPESAKTASEDVPESAFEENDTLKTEQPEDTASEQETPEADAEEMAVKNAPEEVAEENAAEVAAEEKAVEEGTEENVPEEAAEEKTVEEPAGEKTEEKAESDSDDI